MGDHQILVCQCAGRDVVPADVKDRVLSALAAGPADFTVVRDLCGLCAVRDPALLALAARTTNLTVVACHARAVRWLLHAAGVPSPAGRLRVLDMRAQPAAAILKELSDTPAGSLPPAAAMRPDAPPAPAADDWPPWFPVIDQDRCRQCRQCLSFCLFGVYALSSEGQVYVANPQNCKNNCPACSRICPEVAIMFPKLDEAEGPLNGGEIGDETELKARAKVNVQEILGSDVYAALAERRRLAQARRLRRPAAVQAELERAAHQN
jgi:NAD-dependent dihydropyrimidine dehydrogenase PreA subunit